MCELNNKQIALVTADVENAGINYSHLSTDLIDHICCDIESHLNQGISFDKAYARVKREFGIKGLRQIQQDTLMLIDKKYRIMKKSMKMIGMLAMALMAFGALFKIGHWPGASFLLVVSFSFTTLMFFPTLVYVVYKELNNKNLASTFIIAFISGTLFMAGVLFKIMHWPAAGLMFFSGVGTIAFILLPLIIITQTQNTAINKTVFVFGLISLMIFLFGFILKVQHWPGASTLLIAGSILIILAFVPMYYSLEIAKSKKIRVDFIFGVIALTYFIVLTFLLGLNPNNGAALDFQFQDKSFRQSSNYLSTQSKNLATHTQSKDAIQLVDQANLIYDYIEAIKITIVQNHTQTTKIEAKELLQSNILLKGHGTHVDFLLTANNAYSPLPKLKSELEILERFYNNVIGDSLQQITAANSIINTQSRLTRYKNHLVTWEDYYFENCPPSAALSILSLWQYNVRLYEKYALTSLTSNILSK